MEFEIPISTLFTQVFGIAGPLIRRYDIKLNRDNPTDVRFNISADDATEIAELTSNLGTPIELPMGFVAGSYQKLVNGVIDIVDMDRMWLPFTSVASFTRTKRRTKTYMNGQKGGVTEIYGFESWSIRVQGFIIKGNDATGGTAGLDATGSSVEDQVRRIQKWEELTDAIKVHGKAFDWLGIDQVEIVSITYPSARDLDITKIKPYEMVLESVEPYELVNV